MELASKYDPKEVESKWYQYWLDHKLFASKPDGREPYTIVIPPPNVTGVLHMGHMLNNTIQDIEKSTKSLHFFLFCVHKTLINVAKIQNN